jgi:hypothetical protein
MDDHIGQAGRKGRPVRGLGIADWTVLGFENQKIWETFQRV